MIKKTLLKASAICGMIWPLICLVALYASAIKTKTITQIFLLGVVIFGTCIVIYWKLDLPPARWKMIILLNVVPNAFMVQSFLSLIQKPNIWLSNLIIGGTLVIIGATLLLLVVWPKLIDSGS